MTGSPWTDAPPAAEGNEPTASRAHRTTFTIDGVDLDITAMPGDFRNAICKIVGCQPLSDTSHDLLVGLTEALVGAMKTWVATRHGDGKRIHVLVPVLALAAVQALTANGVDDKGRDVDLTPIAAASVLNAAHHINAELPSPSKSLE